MPEIKFSKYVGRWCCECKNHKYPRMGLDITKEKAIIAWNKKINKIKDKEMNKNVS
jgi:expansin (peptidoglycan-binding protein)